MKKQILTILFAMAFVMNCANEEESLEINGSYTDAYATSHTISNDTWINGSSSYTIVSYNNDINTIIAQNGTDNQFNPNKFSKFNYTDRSADGKFYHCTVAYNAASLEAVISVADADSSNPGTSGCGSFAWTQMTSGTGIN
jgi:hypothetical protein